MADVNHSSLSDPYLHEPKGASSANAGEVYVFNGAGSGAATALQDTYQVVLASVSTAETVYLPIIHSGTVSKVVTVLEGAITGGDAIITPKNSAGSSMGTITIANASSAAGDVDTLSPASNNTVSADSFMTVETDGGSTGAQKLWVTVVVDRSS